MKKMKKSGVFYYLCVNNQITNIMYKNFKAHLEKELQDIKDAGLYKNEIGRAHV